MVSGVGRMGGWVEVGLVWGWKDMGRDEPVLKWWVLWR